MPSRRPTFASDVDKWAHDLVNDAVAGREMAKSAESSSWLDPREIRLSSLYKSLMGVQILVINLVRCGLERNAKWSRAHGVPFPPGAVFAGCPASPERSLTSVSSRIALQAASAYFLAGAGVSSTRGLNSLVAGVLLGLISLRVALDQRWESVASLSVYSVSSAGGRSPYANHSLLSAAETQERSRLPDRPPCTLSVRRS